ncbi:MAG: hypothetical protein COA89_10175, partial [Acidithiobacillus sp.]
PPVEGVVLHAPAEFQDVPETGIDENLGLSHRGYADATGGSPGPDLPVSDLGALMSAGMGANLSAGSAEAAMHRGDVARQTTGKSGARGHLIPC